MTASMPLHSRKAVVVAAAVCNNIAPAARAAGTTGRVHEGQLHYMGISVPELEAAAAAEAALPPK